MSHSARKDDPGDGRAMVVIFVLATVAGIVAGDVWIRRNEDSLLLMVLVGGGFTVLGIGQAIYIKNPFRFACLFVGAAGLGVLLRGFAAMT